MAHRLPTRFHIGTQKAGSTYLYNLLASHPDAGLSPMSEINFFSDRFEKGMEWYKGVFPDQGNIIDCSPTYFKYGSVVAERIHSAYGDAASQLRFLLIVRNPIDYVQSHFLMQKQQGFFKKRTDLYPVAPDTLSVCARMYPQYLKRGHYAQLWEEWLRYFSREQFLVIPFEEFVRDEKEVTKRILSFFDLSPRVLSAPQISQNKALRFKGLARIRDFTLAHPSLKRFLKSSPLFQAVFNRFLTVNTVEMLSPEMRRELAGEFRLDVARLTQMGVTTQYWKDF